MAQQTRSSERLTTLVLAVLIVTANGWLAFHEEEVLSNREYWVAHTWEVIDRLEHLMGLVKDAETGERGFLITGDEQFLRPFEKARSSVEPEIDDLIQITADNPSQTTRLHAIKSMAMERVALLAEAVEARKQKGEEAGFAVVRQGYGNAEMERLRQAVAGSQQLEHNLLAARLATSANARTEARLSVAIACALDIFFILLAFWWLEQERRLRRDASEAASRLDKLQAISDVALSHMPVEQLTGELLTRLLRLAEVDGVTLLRSRGDLVEVTASAGLHLTEGRTYTLGTSGPLARAVREGRTEHLNAAEVSGLEIEEFRSQMGAVLLTPMLLEQGVTGVVVAGREQPHSFAPADEKLLAVVADRISVAVRRAALFDSEQAARRQAEQAASEVQALNTELEERVRQRTLDLETTNRELEAFSYSVSHDLRAPLRTIDGFSVALEEDFGAVLTGEGKHYLQRIRIGVQRMGALIDALLQLSRITRAELVTERVDLSAIAAEVARNLTESHPGRKIEWELQLGLSAQADPRLMRAVFENMLGNAVKFTAKVPLARISFGYSPKQRAFFIRDNGAGFEQSYAQKLFVAFQRLHGDKDFAGSGIGLATVARVIRRHHGHIWAEGAVEQGATFWFTLKETA